MKVKMKMKMKIYIYIFLNYFISFYPFNSLKNQFHKLTKMIK